MDFFILSNSSLLKKLNIKTLEKYDGYFVNNQASLKQTCCVWRGRGGEGLDPPFFKTDFYLKFTYKSESRINYTNLI